LTSGTQSLAKLTTFVLAFACTVNPPKPAGQLEHHGFPLAHQQTWSRSLVFAISAAALIVTLSMGVRQSFGLLMQPIGRELGIVRESFGFAIALQNLLFGLAQPFIGGLSDRFGTRPTLILGAVVYAIGLAAAALATDSQSLMASLGVLVGLALSGTTFVVVLSAVGRIASPEQRSVAFGIVTAGGSLGQFAVVPLSQALISVLQWRGALWALCSLILVIVIAAFGLPGRQRENSGSVLPSSEGTLTLGCALRMASRHRHYWLLNGGFFVCGFHVAFVGTHLPAFLVDQGLDAHIGAWSLALIGLFNILGSYLFGVWGGRHSRPWLLSFLYASRGIAMVIFLALPLSPLTALAFAATFGFLWLGTVPLTSGAVASMFGMSQLSTLYGIVFLSHQLGAFLGAWWAGRLFDQTGSYQLIWLISIGLAVIASVLSALTRDHSAMPSRQVLCGSSA
jgi:predicted MFS family arabinose efflux permease